VAGSILVVLSFVLGAIPWGYIAGQVTRGIDLRTVGSGGTGATNVLRTLGKPASALVLLLDVVKGLSPVLIARWLGFDPGWVAAAAVAAVAGHCWSPFIGFRGGKGVATSAGAGIALFPWALLALPVMAAVVAATRYVSLGSLTATAFATLLAIGFAATGRVDWSVPVALLAMTAIVFFRHRENIARLRSGTERRLGERVRV
jgi:glycerol-3-phosphate acyltransferase PlsY